MRVWNRPSTWFESAGAHAGLSADRKAEPSRAALSNFRNAVSNRVFHYGQALLRLMNDDEEGFTLNTIRVRLGRYFAHRGPVKNPELEDYVAAWVDHVPPRSCCPHFRPVLPGQEFQVEAGRELDYLIRRNLSAIKFCGLRRPLLCTLDLTPEDFRNSVARKDWPEIWGRLDCFFDTFPRPTILMT